MPLDTHIFDLIKLMQSSIVPVTVISGVGLILLSMTNRYGRIIDRTHTLLKALEKESCSQDYRTNIHDQLRILYKQATLQRTMIVFCSSSVFFVALSIFFLYAHLKWQSGTHFAEFFFFCSLVTLIVSLVVFIADIAISLDSLKTEIKGHVSIDSLKN